MLKLSLTLIILISAQTLLGMEVEETKPSPITLAQTYYYFTHDLLLVPEVDQLIHSLQLKLNLDIIPDEIKQSCKDVASFVIHINTLLNSYGPVVIGELYKKFFHDERISLCDIKTKQNKTVLHYAAEEKYPAVIQILLKIAGDKTQTLITMQDYEKSTALHYAVNNAESIRLLLDAAGDKAQTLVTMQDYYGTTALHYAAVNNHLEGVELLLNAAGDQAQPLLTTKNNFNRTAFDLTHITIQKVMQKYMTIDQ